ncbi:MAG: hypothetical protein ABIJ39_06165 [Chloroflexota bacterium]
MNNRILLAIGTLFWVACACVPTDDNDASVMTPFPSVTSPVRVEPSPPFPGTPTVTLPPMIEFDYGDGGLISEVPCGPPCFMGIDPGDDLEAVSLTLEHLGLSSYCQWQTRSILCPGFKIGLAPEEQTVWYVKFAPTDITLSDIIEKYREPDRVVIFTMVEINVPSQYHNLELCYPNMMVGLENQEQCYFHQLS